MNFGFLIDNRKCIGCHACSVACKSENEVPVGVNRTWVKYTEKGAFPDTRRFFQVTRCNHCANPPCVYICPTGAMFQRPDGIVEFNRDICIGCKACMQACPYDAVYIDPNTHTAAKCHFCAHRTEVGLEPACVVVCPEHAILAGDLNDPTSEIARTIATQQVRVRKPEQGTKPKLFYVEAEESSIVPGLARQDGLLWATWPDGGQPGGNGQGPNGHNWSGHLAVGSSGHGHSLSLLPAAPRPAAARAPAHAGDWRGPIQPEVVGSLAGALMSTAAAPRETYNVPHRIPWHWQVPSYLVTKAVGAGAFIVSAAGVALGLLPATPLFTSVAAFLALVFIGLTTAFLVWDLDRPERFWTILIRPQWRSWLARGAFILIGFSGVAGLYWLGHVLGFGQWANRLIWPGVVLAVLSATYTAFLFAQAEGRDLWQSTLLPWHLFVQAVMAGAAALLIAGALLGAPPAATQALAWILGSSLLVNLLVTVGGEFGTPHASQVAAAAAHQITHGRFRGWYWFSLLAGLALPLALVALSFALPAAAAWLLAAAGLLAVAGLFAYEWAFVMAPQHIPNN